MTPATILRYHNLSHTQCREEMLSVIMDASGSVSYRDIITLLGARYNRTTVYRTFKTFEKQGIIRKITIDRRLVRYEISSLHQHVLHAHFFCRKCGNLFCLEDPLNISIELPEKFHTEETEIILKGLCLQCK